MKHKLLIGILAVTVGAGLLGYLCGRNGVRPSIMPVADRQRFLQKAGFYEGRVDGICGELTHAGQLAWEKQEINESVIYWMKRMEIKPMETKTQKGSILVTWGFSDHDRAILKEGVQYLYKGELYYWYGDSFHRRHRIPKDAGVDERRYAMVWEMICNPDFEKAIFDDGVKVKVKTKRGQNESI